MGFYRGLLIHQMGIKQQLASEKGNICMYAPFLTFPEFVILLMTTAKRKGLIKQEASS